MEDETFQRHDIVVIGASSGGIEALTEIVAGLPLDFAAAVFVVVHIPSHGASVLPQILERAGALKALHPADNEPIVPGRIYVAPPDRHLLIEKGRIRIVRGPRENNHRPAIDPLFRTAARTYSGRVVGVVLSGSLDDGSVGLLAIKRRGGIAIVQDPADALFPDMPRHAMEATEVDYCVARTKIADVLVQASQTPVPAVAPPVSEELEKESEIEAMDMAALADEDHPGTPSVFGCPDCGGTLWELQNGDLLRFRCRVGHAFSAEGLLSTQSVALETALWNAFRALEENAALAHRLADRARRNNHTAAAQSFEKRSIAAQEQAHLIHDLLLSGKVSEAAESGDSS